MFGYKCQECHQGTVQATRVGNFETKFENVPFVVREAVIGICDSCGAQHFSGREYKRWKEAFQEWQEERGRVMSAVEIRQLRKDLGMTMTAFAALIGTTRQSLHHWEKDDRETAQSRMVDNLLKLLRKNCDEGRVDVATFLYECATRCGVDVEMPAYRSNVVDDHRSSGARKVVSSRHAPLTDFGSLYPERNAEREVSPHLIVIAPQRQVA